MKQIELVISIPEGDYNYIKNYGVDAFVKLAINNNYAIEKLSQYTEAIKNGILLPEGEIVDIRPLMRGLYEEMCTGEVTYITSDVYKMLEEECQVIIDYK